MNTDLNDTNTATDSDNAEARKLIADARAQLDADSRDLHQQMIEALEKKNSNAQISAQPEKGSQDQSSTSETNPKTTRNEPDKTDGETGTRPRSPYEPAFGPLGYLNTLPAETQAYIKALLDEYSLSEVSAILAKPAPEGIAREISSQARYRFNHRNRQTSERHRLASLAQKVRSHLDNPDATDADFSNATARFIRASLLDSVTEMTTLDLLKSIHTMVNSLRRTDIAERRINLAERKEKK